MCLSKQENCAIMALERHDGSFRLVMHILFKGGIAASLVLGLAACASSPDEQPVEQVRAPAKVIERVAEVARPDPKPIERVAPQSGPIGPLAGSVQDFRTNVGERVYFDLSQWRLDGSDQEILKRQAAWLSSYPNVRILVAGNCDERGTREYNLALGERRAATVKEYLVDLGVDPSRIETVSYGKERPIDGGTTEAAWALNRNGFTQIVSGARTS